jgi:hypothetical protein
MASRLSGKEAAIEVLKAEGKPLHYKEICRLAIERGLYTPSGKTPEETINAQLCVALKKDPTGSPVIRVQPCIWGLRDGGAVSLVVAPRRRRDAITFDANESGTLVMFRGRDAFATPAELERTLDDAGIDWVSVPQDLDPVQRAVRSVSSYRTARATGRPTKVEVLQADADSVTFGILFKEEVRKGQEVGWVQHETVSYGPAGWTHPATPEGQGFVVHASRWQQNLDYNWIRDRIFVSGFERLGGFSVGGSGLYYVHGAHQELKTLRSVARAIGRSDLNLLAVGVDDDSRAMVGDAAVDAIASRVVDVTSKLEKWREKSGGRASTLAGMMSELVEIREQAAQLAAALRFSTTEIEDAMNAAVADVRSAMEEAGAVFGDDDGEAETAPETTPAPEPPAPEPPVAPKVEKDPFDVEEKVPAPKRTEPETRLVTGDDPFADEPEQTEGYLPTVEELENAPAAQIRAWAADLGLEMRVKGKPKSTLVLATEISKLREERQTA